MIIDCFANIHLGAAIRGHFGDLGQFAAGHSLQPLCAAGVILEMRKSYFEILVRFKRLCC